LRDGQRQREAVLRWLVLGAVRWYAADRVMPPVPERVLADTADWRAKSDPIEGFWVERLRPAEPGSFITVGDMMAAFNAYLLSINQREWSDRRFNPAFGDHTTTKRHGVEYKQARVKPEHVRSYRIPDSHSVTVPSPFVPEPTAVGSKVRAWWGVRFATQTDHGQD
jgi:putative DNA primase/helicase